jgi:hypothetical protein
MRIVDEIEEKSNVFHLTKKTKEPIYIGLSSEHIEQPKPNIK